jgi:transposase
MISKEELRKMDKEDLVNLTYNLCIMVDKLILEVQELRAELKLYKTKKNSSNSSLPPSHDLFKGKNQSLREKSDKKSGGQKGHKGETLRMTSDPNSITKHFPEPTCPK